MDRVIRYLIVGVPGHYKYDAKYLQERNECISFLHTKITYAPFTYSAKTRAGQIPQKETWTKTYPRSEVLGLTHKRK